MEKIRLWGGGTRSVIYIYVPADIMKKYREQLVGPIGEGDMHTPHVCRGESLRTGWLIVLLLLVSMGFVYWSQNLPDFVETRKLISSF